MQSPDESFQELLLRLEQGRRLDNAGDDPIFYLIYSPALMLDIKRKIRTWTVKLQHAGWNPSVMSMAETVSDILGNHDLRDVCLEAEQDDPLNFPLINGTLASVLIDGEALLNRIRSRLKELEAGERNLLLITDVEALHPYLRIGTIEANLAGKFAVPTVILYPGTRSGRFSLSFLGMYPEDGNYRSVHIG
jgi:hypothetical protein